MGETYPAETVRRVEHHLDALEAARSLGGSNRRYALLRHLVGAELAGRGDALKAYAIGVDVLGRGADFDPSSDSIVRVEIARLRDALALHYFGAGAGDGVRIDIPKGTYRPRIVLAPETRPRPEAARRLRPPSHRTRIVAALAAAFLLAVAALAWTRAPGAAPPRPIGPLVLLSGDAAADTMGAVAETLTRFRNIAFLAPGSGRAERADYRIDVAAGSGGRFTVALSHVASGRLVDSRQFRAEDRGLGAPAAALTPLRVWLARLAQTNGVIERDHVQSGGYGPGFRCMALTEAYFAQQTDARHAEALRCVEEQLDTAPGSAQLHAALSFLYREEYTDRRNAAESDPLARALAAARRAIEIEPFGAQGHYAMMTVLFAEGNVSDAIASGRTAMDLCPLDGALTGGFAARLVGAGRYREALELLRRSDILAPGKLLWRYHAVFLANMGLGDTDRAAEAALALTESDNPLYLAATAIGLAHRGHPKAAAERYRRLIAIEPAPRRMYARRRYDPALIDRLVSRLDAISARTPAAPSP